MKFSEVFEELIEERNISIKELSEKLDIDNSNLYDYLHGIIPEVEFAVRIANFFDCSLSYLMGLEEEKTSTKFKQTYDMSLFSKRYDDILEESNISHFKVCKDTKLNYSSHYAWQRGALPKMKSLILIADYFGVSIDYLVGRSDKK